MMMGEVKNASQNITYVFSCFNPNDDGQGPKMPHKTKRLYFAALKILSSQKRGGYRGV
jgi:hypothetical protein